MEAATASAFDPNAPPSRCIEDTHGQEGRCYVPSKPSGNTWLQLNLQQSERIVAYQLRRVCTSCEYSDHGVANHQVWVSDTYDQDYTNFSQRCSTVTASEVSSSAVLISRSCIATGRFVRLRVMSRTANISLVTFELFTDVQPEPLRTTTSVLSSVPLVRNWPVSALFPLAGQSTQACVEMDDARRVAGEVCGYDAVACGDARLATSDQTLHSQRCLIINDDK